MAMRGVTPAEGRRISGAMPVMFIAAVLAGMDEAKAFEAGGVDKLAKSFHPVTGKARVKNHIRLSGAIKEPSGALARIKTLNGLLPICATCEKIRGGKGYWKRTETYIISRTGASLSHGICPDRAKKRCSDHLGGWRGMDPARRQKGGAPRWRSSGGGLGESPGVSRPFVV